MKKIIKKEKRVIKEIVRQWSCIGPYGGKVEEAVKITKITSEACRLGIYMPIWILLIRATVSRIHLQKKRIQQLEKELSLKSGV